MQVRATEPDPIQRLIRIAVRLPKMLKTPRIPGVQRILIGKAFVCVGVQAMGICSDFVDRRHLPNFRTAESMAICTGLHIDLFAGGN